MYRVVKERRAWWPVTFNGVTEAGRVVENKIDMRFFVHGEDEHAQLTVEAARLPARAAELVMEELAGEDVSEAELQRRTAKVLSRLYADFLPRMACDWREVCAENEEPLRFTEADDRQALMNVPGVFKAVTEAYGRCRLGKKDLKEGN